MKATNNLLIYLILTFILFINTNGQGIAIGQWRDHLPYSNCIAVAEANNKIYCATSFGLFYYDKNDFSINRFSKVNGLSDIEIKTIRFNKKYNLVIIGYSNTNIDVIDGNGNIINIQDIKQKNILGSKTINNISFINDVAYLSCSFGIVVLNLAKLEISDTYYIGLNSSALNVNDITSDDTYIYAATDKGVYKAKLQGTNLLDYNYWTTVNELVNYNKKYNGIKYFNNRLYANLHGDKYNSDTLYVLNNNKWEKFRPQIELHNLTVENNNLIISALGFIDVIDNKNNSTAHIYTYNTGAWVQPNDALTDANNNIWIADKQSGLVKRNPDDTYQIIIPNGPATNNVISMAIQGENLWVVPGGRDDTWNNLYINDGVFTFNGSEWTSFTPGNTPACDTISDYISVAVDPLNKNDAYVGTWTVGLIKFSDNKFNKIYNENNSSLIPLSLPGYRRLRVGGIHFDADNNMWVTNPGSKSPLSVKLSGDNGKWYSFHLNGVGAANALGDLIIDNYNQKWIIVPRGVGLAVFNDNNTPENPSDDKSKLLDTQENNGKLPSSSVYSIALDLDGTIWVGTDKGVVIFSNPDNVFTGNNFDCEQITIVQDGYNQYLLETEIVTAIAVDGANRKWFGTQNSGVYLMSADGLTQIEHFTAENSPLFSNTISSIAINKQSGEVYFGTAKGIISYRGDATDGGEKFNEEGKKVYVFPNPVKENYNGPIAIKGLVRDAQVIISDIAGDVVFKTTALGGQAIWNGKNLEGIKVKTGVYLVFASNSDGKETLVTKILFIN